MRRHRPSTRGGFTLLEVLLASVVATVLLGAVYAALDLTINLIDANRRVIAASDVTRAVTSRLIADMTNTLGPLPPNSGGSDPVSQGAAAAPSDSSGAAGASAPASTASVPADPDAPSAAASGLNVPFGAGVIGSDKQVTLFVSRLPGALTDPALANPTALPTSDLTRVTYYLASDGAGLARQAHSAVTADGVWNASDPDRSNELTDVIAPEVKDITFEYYDGGSWLGSWDGSATDVDGVSLTGPPRAVRVTLVLQLKGRSGPYQKTVMQTIPLRAAVGNFLPETPADPAATTPAGGP
jgi:prepilin-type N-terminal cleavage/methylation domain-containing protein